MILLFGYANLSFSLPCLRHLYDNDARIKQETHNKNNNAENNFLKNIRWCTNSM